MQIDKSIASFSFRYSLLLFQLSTFIPIFIKQNFENK